MWMTYGLVLHMKAGNRCDKLIRLESFANEDRKYFQKNSFAPSQYKRLNLKI